MKVREAIELLQISGWALVATRDSHRQYKHSDRPGRVTVAEKPSVLAPGKLNSILKQAGLKEDGQSVPLPTSLAEYVEA